MTKRRQFTITVILFSLLTMPLRAAQEPPKGDAPKPPSPHAAAFAKLKSLAGDWTGTAGQPDGSPAKSNYRVVSGGTAVQETLFPGTPHEMISVFFLKNGRLVLTHYCSIGNQPEMACVKETATELVFEFTGGSNLDPAKDGHIHGCTIRFVGPDQIEEEWRYFENGVLNGTERLYLRRPATQGQSSN